MNYGLLQPLFDNTANRFFDIEGDELDPNADDFEPTEIAIVTTRRNIVGLDADDIAHGFVVYVDATGRQEMIKDGGYFTTNEAAIDHGVAYFTDDLAEEAA